MYIKLKEQRVWERIRFLSESFERQVLHFPSCVFRKARLLMTIPRIIIHRIFYRLYRHSFAFRFIIKGWRRPLIIIHPLANGSIMQILRIKWSGESFFFVKQSKWESFTPFYKSLSADALWSKNVYARLLFR